MDYQDLIDQLLANPRKPGLAGNISRILATIAAGFGRHRAPELAGINLTVLAPNADQPVSGEIHQGHVVNQGNAQFHAADNRLPQHAVQWIFGVPAPAQPSRGLAPKAVRPEAQD